MVNRNMRFCLMVALLLGASVSQHMMWRSEVVSLAQPLSMFPTTLDGWQGRDIQLEQWQLNALGIDDHVSRMYLQPGAGPLFLYIGYYRSQRTGQVVHTPRNCLPGSGWEPIRARLVNLGAANGHPVAVNFYIVEKGLDQQVVLYWYQAHGRVVASEYWGKVYTVVDAIRLNRTDASVIRISSPIVDHDEAKVSKAVVAFAQHTMLQVDSLIPR